MSIQIIPFDSASLELRGGAHEFCAQELTLPEGETEWDLSKFAKAWIAVKDGLVVGVTAYMLRVDIAVFRSVSDRATARLNHRLHSYFADQGLLGQDIFIQFSKQDEAKLCANWQKEFERAGISPANRYMVRVKPL